MGDRLLCPGCDAETSSVWLAYRDGRACPHCGLSAESILELTTVRKRHADSEFLKEYEQAVKRVGRLEAENAGLRKALGEIQDAVRQADIPNPDLKENGEVDTW